MATCFPLLSSLPFVLSLSIVPGHPTDAFRFSIPTQTQHMHRVQCTIFQYRKLPPNTKSKKYVNKYWTADCNQLRSPFATTINSYSTSPISWHQNPPFITQYNFPPAIIAQVYLLLDYSHLLYVQWSPSLHEVIDKYKWWWRKTWWSCPRTV